MRATSVVASTSMLAGILVVSIAGPVHAAPGAVPGSIVISELNYHAGSDLDADDFVELTNTTAAPVDISGWSFSAGVTGTFAAGTVLGAKGYLVVAKDTAQFQTTYGFAPNAVYGGNLSNGGETVTLVDAALATMDTVTYADVAPWPTAPDGTGPSLELRDLMADKSLPQSWGASLAAGGTPGARNSIDGSVGGTAPVVAGLTAAPSRPANNQPVVVSARLEPGSTAQLTYKVMFGADVVVSFLDDAASPGGAGDGVYAASIPGQSAGKLIRYRVDAKSAGTSYSVPAAGDSARYRGVVVVNSTVSSQLPVIEWFMEDAVYDDILANHRADDVQGAAVWSYNGEVIDGALMSVRGNSSRTEPKVNWKVELPKGYTFDLAGQLPYPLDSFALQNYSDNFADVGWATVEAAGNRALNIVPVRTQRNGAFWSLGRIMETEDGSWRAAQGVKDWAIYKADIGGSVGRTTSPAVLQAKGWLAKKTRKSEDFTDVWTLSNTVDAPPSAAQQAWIYQNVNLPELVNYMAINSIIRHQDSGWYNWWLARDTDGTGRWEMWQWDLNWIFTTAASDGKGLFLTPDTSNHFTQAMLAYPEIKEMFYRRLRTLADQFLAPGQYEAHWDAISAKTTPDWNLNYAKWKGYTPAYARSAFVNGLTDRRNAINNNTGAGKPVPTTQAADANVVINEIQYHPAGTGGEYIELANPGNTAVDISGWAIDAVGLTIQAGTVIPAGGRIVFVANDKAFRQAYTGANRLVGGQFTGSLDDAGEAVVLRDATRTVDSVTYSNQAPWPAAADGTGPSLELVSPSADNAVAASWRAASTTGGTPGLANTADTAPPVNVAPVAAFTSSVNALSASMDGSGSKDPDGTISSYAWNFGDGSTGSGVSANHTYAAAGSYTVTLTVTDNAGAKGTVNHQVTVASTPPPVNVAPVAAFTSSVNALSASMDGSASKDPDGTISSYAWNFGDGSTGTGLSANHTYAAAGSYTVTLTVTDNAGAKGTVNHQVTVASTPPPVNVAPVAAFTSSVNALSASMDGSASKDPDGTISSYAWNFGDGSTGTGVSASHSYATAGTYTVTLNVTDNGGATGTVNHPVTVTGGPPPVAVPLAQDAFNRTVSGGLGTADTGGPWTISGAVGDFAVKGGAATIASPARSNRYAYLNGVSSSDTEVRATIGFNRPTASSIYAGLIGRRVGTNTYGARVVVSSTGTVQLNLQRNTDTILKSATISGLTFNSGDRLQVRLQVTGTSPTTLQAKVWKTGTTEPANWQLATTDSTAGFQAAGAIGLYSYLSTTGTPTPLTVTFDDLWAGGTK
ncbi:PKD domain-containing protein [Paeniglutamicibacter antarcticus]|uniref:PKD domain-containing protein n=1 Tax=Arthrobacter terrae TaxID=2935737 RepID=A0A931CN52_9MICC|nr:PKD domain-containing protein [Arthrobacter terrae]MBG0737866.1 PKD domain-containing protein [Arthrobacter terrae]